jgi:protein SCO1/2
MRRAFLAAVLALVAAGCGSAPASHGTGPFTGATQLPPGLLGRPAASFRLQDARDGTLNSTELLGRPYAVTFLYTECPDVCPLIGEEIHAALDAMGPRARAVNVVAISVDPRHDTAANVRVWLRRHREPSNFHYLIGSEAQLAPVWKGYFAAPQVPGDPQSSHTAAVWLVDREGRLAAKYDAGAAFAPADLAHDLGVLLDR